MGPSTGATERSVISGYTITTRLSLRASGVAGEAGYTVGPRTGATAVPEGVTIDLEDQKSYGVV